MSASFDPSVPLQILETNVLGVFAGVGEQIMDANDVFLRMLGYTRGDLEAGRLNWRALTPPELMPFDERAAQQSGTRGWNTPYFKQFIRADGSRADVLVMGARVQPAIRRWVGVAIDAGHLVSTPGIGAAPDARQLDAVLEACPWPATYLRQDGSWLAPNEAMRTWFQVSPGSAGAPWDAGCTREGRDAIAIACAQVLSGIVPTLSVAAAATAPNGESHSCRFRVTALPAEAGDERRAVCFVEDLDAERTLRDRALRAESMRTLLMDRAGRVTLIELDATLASVQADGAHAETWRALFRDPFGLPVPLQAALQDALDGLERTWAGLLDHRPVTASVSPLRGVEGRVTGVAIVLEPTPPHIGTQQAALG
jgi:PAS domain S-box-containing protein